MLGSPNGLTSSGNERLDRMQRLTSPGMIDWVDIDGDHHCASCRHFHKHRCQLFLQLMRSRLKNSKFLGPKLPRGQRACRRYEKAQGAGAFGHASMGDTNMVSISEKYPQKGILKAADVQGDDLVVQIDRVDFDEPLGSSGKYVNLVRLTNDERSLELKQTIARIVASLHGDETDLWSGKWIALFYDPTVKFGEETTGGVRVRPRVPTEEEIAAAAPPTKQPGSEKPAVSQPGDGKRPGFGDDETPF